MSGENVERQRVLCKLRVQVLRVASRRVGPFILSLREEAHYFQDGGHLLRGCVQMVLHIYVLMTLEI